MILDFSKIKINRLGKIGYDIRDLLLQVYSLVMFKSVYSAFLESDAHDIKDFQIKIESNPSGVTGKFFIHPDKVPEIIGIIEDYTNNDLHKVLGEVVAVKQNDETEVTDGQI